MVNLSTSLDDKPNNRSVTRRVTSKSRSRSRSSGFHSPWRRYRSRSKERCKYRTNYRDRDIHCKRTKYDSRRSPLSPLLQRKRSSNGKFSLMDSESRVSRLQKPEIQGGVHLLDDFSNDRIRTTSHNIENEEGSGSGSLSLTDRFTRYTSSGTAIFNKRRHSRTSDHFRLPHLILTNNTRLPPATLVRQAKEISIVIERTFPLNTDKLPNSTGLNADEIAIIIPRHPGEGHKPVFDRPEIKFYNTQSEEAAIGKRLSEKISSTSKSRQSSQYGRKSTKVDYHDISQFIGPGRFYGSRVEERLDSKSAYPLDPSEIPKGQSYYLHDNRQDDNYRPRRRWNNSISGRSSRTSDSSYRRGRRTAHSPTSRSRSSKHSNTENQWLHDKFEELHAEHANSTSKPTPKPVPAPKPILWSTIGKEVLNGDTLEGKDCADYSPNSAINQSPLIDAAHTPSPVNKNKDENKETENTDIVKPKSPDVMTLDLDC